MTPALHLDDSGGDGLPVVFQHGLLGDAAQPAEVFPRDAAFRRLTLEMRGHGRSETGDVAMLSIANFADDLIAMIERSRLAPLVIGGISMGAAIAMRIAVLRPGLVRGLIIARPAWSTAAAPANMRANAEAGELLRRYPAAQAQGIFEASATAQRLAREAPDNLASLRGFFSRPPRQVTAALLSAISADGPGVSAAELRAVAIPALVIAHARDEIHPLGLARELAGIIPSARLVEITPKAVDRQRYAAEFRDAVARFLREFL